MYKARAEVAALAGITFAQVMLTLFPGTVDVDKWERCFGDPPPEVEGIPITRHWLIPSNRRPTSTWITRR